MQRLVDNPPSDFVAVNRAVLTDLGASTVSVTAGPLSGRGAERTAAIVEKVEGAGLSNPLSLSSQVALHRVRGQWLVSWTAQTIDPSLGPGDHFDVSDDWAPRAAITGAGGAPLMAAEPMVEVGLVGQRLHNPAAVTSLLRAAGATQAEITPAIAAAEQNPTFFEPVFTVTAADFTANIRQSELYQIPGTQFETTTQEQAVTPGLGEYLLGRLGPVTAEELSQLGRPYTAADVVGQGGLEGEYEKRLAGSPGQTVSIVSASGATVATLYQRAPVPGTPLATTIDPAVQKAAESAIAGTTQPSALVAIQASTGEILAVANNVPGGSGFDYALDATEAPGSTFKVVTSTALINHGLTPQSPATCPATRTVDGETFHNDEGEASGSINLLTAFAQSCNTAFIGLAAANLTGTDLVSAAASYDIGITPQMGFPAYGGDVPLPKDQADLASTAIGQGQITVSPLDLAMVAAAVDSSTVREPRLVIGAPDDSAAVHAVPPAVDADLRAMMAQVVATGTAAGKGLPSGTYGKTGTAEFGSANPPLTHAWFIGFRGDLAFAVYVDQGSSGGAAAAPIAASFLNAAGPVS
jgi:cell division protein FtsI/penicillin-binding protein 2